MFQTRMMSGSSTDFPIQKEQDHLRALEQVLKYHNQTKHSLTRYARGPHGLDWPNQPNPFRRYVSAPLLPLHHLPPRPQHPDDPLYTSLFQSLPCPRLLSLPTLSRFLYDSLSLSAWKTTGHSTWSVRVNPSSGNLHPTEAYIISPPVPFLCESPFVAHYAPKEHALERRAVVNSDFFSRFFPEGSFLVGLSSIFWRESWKYGERAFRYCNHDAGHAIAAVVIAAGALGWDVKLLDGLGFKDLENIMGLGPYQLLKIPSSSPTKGRFPELEFEHPDCLLLVFPKSVEEITVDYARLTSAIAQFPSLKWEGKPNSLSKDHVCWDFIYRTAEAVKKPLRVDDHLSISPFRSSVVLSDAIYKSMTVREVVRKRRSAVDMDGVHIMERETFYQILIHCLPAGAGDEGDTLRGPSGFPFRVLPWEAEVHFALFVHRVKGLPKGLYFFVRNESHLAGLKQASRPEFLWEKPEGCPNDLHLYKLSNGDCQRLAKQLSCHQDIAADGCFSLGMIARFEEALREKKAWMYPRLFWETGILGQVLYLEAHAVGISATGIGCYFDDAVHEVLGFKGSEFQSLYHFTVGGPVLDKRIMSLPAYPGPAVDA
ncbi:uncharacterized protein [Aristolochia californica]|uniref:uncharacterized protein isoform X1 n=1 Tax=Aristolochia californica TaxID=171875 RepID=UPI0035DE4EA2